MYIDRGVYKPLVVYSDDRVLVSDEKEWTADNCNDMRKLENTVLSQGSQTQQSTLNWMWTQGILQWISNGIISNNICLVFLRSVYPA